MVTGHRNLDERGDPASSWCIDLAHLPGHDAVLGAEQRHPAVQPGQQGGPELRQAEDPRIELPRPAALDLAYRRLGDMPGDVAQGGLVRNGMEPGDGRRPGGVDAQRPEGAVLARRLLFRGEVTDGRIDDDRPGDPGPVEAGQPQRNETAHAVPDRRVPRGGIPAAAATASTSRAHMSRL